MPKISVIVPVYNAEKYLSECVDSILLQTYADYELILVDDGSKDRSGEICDKYAKQDSRIRVIHKENAGVSKARNTGIDAALGEFITFIDSDDTIDDSFFCEAVRAVSKERTDLFISGLNMETYNETGTICQTITYGIHECRSFSVRELFESMEVLFPQICICGPCCKLFKSSIIKKNGICFDSRLNYGEDTDFNLNFLSCCKSIFFSDKVYYHYRRINGDSLFSRFHKDTYEVVKYVYGKMRSLMDGVSCGESTKNRFEIMYFHLLVGGIHEYYRHFQQTSFHEKRELVKKISRDENVKKLSMTRILTAKDKATLFLLKIRAYSLICLAFFLKYRVVSTGLSGRERKKQTNGVRTPLAV